MRRTLAEGKAARETYEYLGTLEIEGDEAEALLRDVDRSYSLSFGQIPSLDLLSNGISSRRLGSGEIISTFVIRMDDRGY